MAEMVDMTTKVVVELAIRAKWICRGVVFSSWWLSSFWWMGGDRY